MKMKNQLTPLQLLDKFFNTKSAEEIEKKLEAFENKKFEGPLVNEYFDEFNIEYKAYHSSAFHNEIDEKCQEIWNEALINYPGKNDIIEVKKYIKVKSTSTEVVTINDYSDMPLAA